MSLKKIRIHSGYSRAELARVSGLSKSAVEKLERGEFAPRPRSLVALANALGVAPEAISHDRNIQ